MLSKRNLVLGIIGAVFFSLCACNSDQKTSENEVTIQTASVPDSNIEQVWPNSNELKEFKIDSSNFKVYASKYSWLISLERTASYDSQLNKIKKVSAKISKEADLKDLNEVIIQSLNNELLLDIALVAEIQSELIQRSGKVNSMRTVTPNAYKSKYLNGITDTFQKFELEPFDYYIDKCRGEEIQGDSVLYTLKCSSIIFKLRKIEKE